VLVLVSLFIAATAVEPFLYSALIIEVAVLMSCIILVTPGQRNSPGLLRYLIYQTLAVPFILFSGWITGVAGINPADPTTINLIVLLVGLGFAFWLAVFPFYTWIPLLSEESEPISKGFILGMLPSFILFLLLKFMDGYIWLRESSFVFNIFLVAGILMVATGGIWSLFQKKLSRLLGYAVIMETGFVFIALGLKSGTGLQFFALSIFPRMFGVAIWSFILSFLRNNHIEDSIEGIKGLYKKMPWAAYALVAILLAFAGVPLFVFSPERLILLQALANQDQALLVWVFLGILGFIIGGFRFIAAIFQNILDEGKITEGKFSNLLLIIELILLILMGIVPSALFSGVNRLLLTFPFLKW
jgi:NADH-quinone oxidoreductase subunit N